MEKHWSLIVKIIICLLAVAALIWLVFSLSWLINLLLISTLLVYILDPLRSYLERRFKLKKNLATIVVFSVFILFCLFMLSLLVPVIYFEATELAESIPHHTARVQVYLSWLSQQTIRLDIEEEVRGYLLNLSDNLHQTVEYLAEASISLIGGAVGFFLVLFLVFYLLYDFQEVRKQIIALVPPAQRSLAVEILAIIDRSVGAFIRGSLVRCLIVGIVTGMTLYFFGMPYALLLGLIAGLFNFILYIGPYIAAVPALLLSFSPLTPSPFAVILIYVVIQILDGMFLAPVLLGRAVRLRPITIIVAILAGGILAGILGMLLSVPVASIIKNILELLKRSPSYTGAEELDG